MHHLAVMDCIFFLNHRLVRGMMARGMCRYSFEARSACSTSPFHQGEGQGPRVILCPVLEITPAPTKYENAVDRNHRMHGNNVHTSRMRRTRQRAFKRFYVTARVFVVRVAVVLALLVPFQVASGSIVDGSSIATHTIEAPYDVDHTESSSGGHGPCHHHVSCGAGALLLGGNLMGPDMSASHRGRMTADAARSLTVQPPKAPPKR